MGSRQETTLIERIVKDIISRLQLDRRSKLPPIIGLESSIKEITSFLKDDSRRSTGIFAIGGMPGIGKTHLAKYVFHLHCLEFERSCLLEDIERKCEAPEGLLDLQKQLLKDMRVGSYIDINSVNEGTFNIENSLLKNRTLLVLDGINKFEQLEVLIGTKGLHPGSKIIITSNRRSLTEKCGLCGTQVPPEDRTWLEGLSDQESLKLLSWYAFGCYEPNEVDKKHAEKVVEYCQGHPLALKVLGSSLHNEDATWEDILESLGREINPDITKVLKIGFDTLPFEKDKELFKIIACLFVGEDRNYVEEILKACGMCKSSGIKILIDRCLLDIDSHDKLKMHQLLQDMGRDIVREESPKKPWKRSILWHHVECLDVLQNRQGTSIIQGLAFDTKKFENETLKESIIDGMQMFSLKSYLPFRWVHMLLSIIWWLFGWVSGMCSSSHKTKGDIETLALSEMRNLRLLQLNYVQLKGSYKHFPQGLRWLCMHGFPLCYIPSELQMENLVALDLSNSKLQQLWKEPKLLKSLKFLNLSNCHALVRVGHFSGLPLLERLTLKSCISLVEVCESIGVYCLKLDVLDLSGCIKLKGLPRSIGKLKSSTQLLINGCSSLYEFPVEMKDMESLEVLKADNINMKSHGSSSSMIDPRSPVSLWSWLPGSLVELSMKNCNLYIESFPKDFSNLPKLKKLCLDGNQISSMPDCVRSLSSLEILSFKMCSKLKTITFPPIQTNFMIVLDCNSLEKITFHPEQSALPRVICFLSSTSLSEIWDEFKIQNLSEIDKEVLRGLGWIDVKYLNHCRFGKVEFLVDYYYLSDRILPAQMLYQHGIFSTYLQEEEVPKWFTHRSNGSSFTLQSSPKNGKIKGINVCVVHKISKEIKAGPFRIKIRNLTKKSSWTYQPMMFLVPQDEDEVVVWLTHWMFGKNEFEDGDEVSIHFSSKYYVLGSAIFIYDTREADYANVKEYGMSLVYDEGIQKEDPLAYYKYWKHIIGGDLSKFEVSSDQYLLSYEQAFGFSEIMLLKDAYLRYWRKRYPNPLKGGA